MSYLLKKPCSQAVCPKNTGWCVGHYISYPPDRCRILIEASSKPDGERACKVLEKIGGDLFDDMRARTIDALNSDRITHQASLIRPGHTCSLIIPPIPDGDSPVTAEYKIGWINIHLPLVFDDGVKWIVRIPRRHSGDAPANLHSLVASSEVATLQLLYENGAKVPNAWMPVGGNPDEAANGRYFFEDRYAAAILEFAEHDVAVANNTKLEVQGIGWLYPSPTSSCGYTLGPITSMGTFMLPEPPYFLGPSRTLRDRYLAHIN
ncbi:hypothetical protein IAR50_007444 [Cryptococcus sp. DSM 104548]